MVEIIKSNFDEHFKDITDRIRNASFIALDSEFTGLVACPAAQRSLFDSSQERYQKSRISCQSFTLCQLGLTIVRRRPGENCYDAYPYQFYLRPSSIGKANKMFSMEIESIEFLNGANFDYNKWLYHGVPFLNQEDEAFAQDSLRDGKLLDNIDSLDDTLQDFCSTVSLWYYFTSDEDLTLDLPTTIEANTLLCLLALRFPHISADILPQGQITIRKVGEEERKVFDIKIKALNERIASDIIGFSKILKVLIEAKKPLVGHNMLLDLLLVYHHLYKPLPRSYAQFKKEIHRLFPVVFDTKHLVYQLKKEMDFLNINHLLSTHRSISKYMEQKRMTAPDLFVPQINIASGCEKYDKKNFYHEAGFDSYITACCFIKLAHLKLLHDLSPEKYRSFLWAEHYQVLEQHKNKVNLIQATIHHVNLEGADLVSDRPPILYVELNNALSLKEVTELLSHHGLVDVRPLGQNRALVATSSFACARSILSQFSSSSGTKGQLTVSRYSILHHSRLVRFALWLGFLGSSVTTLILALRFLR